MRDVDAFHEQVSAYPAISILRRQQQGAALVADTVRGFGPDDAAALMAWSRRRTAEPVVADRYKVSRGAVTGGAHLDALAELVEEVFIDAGFPPVTP
jgi:hypothetical protein